MTRRIALWVLSVVFTGIAWAGPNDEDNYTRLARVSYIEGNVSYQHATDVDWSAASINLPLVPGDRIYASSDGRAEIEFDDGSVYRLANNTDVEILSLREDLIQLRVLVGLSTLVAGGDADFEIDTPAAAFNTMQRGSYRFNVQENGESDAIVRKGKLEAANNDFSRRIESGEMLHVAMGGGNNPELARYDRRDAWDEWNDRRNADLNAYGNRRYVPETVYIGVSDLHRYGRWVQVESYGSAWVPYSVDVYWSPYSVGRWCYRPIFGWTWVSYEPWGWLPYHYGRWYRSSAYGWCWLPGPSFAFNFWSPGLVAFYSGPGWISWCPLGPGDYYDVHDYHYNRGVYGRQLDQLVHLYTRNRGDLFNRHAPNAFRTVPLDRFRGGSFGDRDRATNWTKIDQPWKHGEFVQDSLSIRPTAASYRANPERPAVRPVGERSLPAVIRSSPAYNARGQEHFTRITNPQIPSLPSRSERMRNAAQDSNAVAGERPGGRVVQTPQRERENTRQPWPQRERPSAGAQNPPAGGSVEQGGRRMTTPRWGRTTDNRGEGRPSEENDGQGNRPGVTPPTARQSTNQGRPEQAAPAQRQMNRAPAEAKPNKEERRPDKSSEPRSRSGGNARSESSAVNPAPSSNGSGNYYSYRPSAPSSEPGSGGRADTARTYATPAYRWSGNSGSTAYDKPSPPADSDSGARSYSYRSYSAPSASSLSRSRSGGEGSAFFERSTPSFQRNGGARSFSTPSLNRGGGASSFSSGSFRRSSGGGNQKSQERGSSGGNRGRR